MRDKDESSEAVQSLNLMDLSIEELEARLEMAHPVFHPDGYECGTDCKGYTHCGVDKSPEPQL